MYVYKRSVTGSLINFVEFKDEFTTVETEV